MKVQDMVEVLDRTVWTRKSDLAAVLAAVAALFGVALWIVGVVAFFSLGSAADGADGALLAGVLGVALVPLAALVRGGVRRRSVGAPRLASMALALVPLVVAEAGGGSAWLLAGAVLAALPEAVGV